MPLIRKWPDGRESVGGAMILTTGEPSVAVSVETLEPVSNRASSKRLWLTEMWRRRGPLTLGERIQNNPHKACNARPPGSSDG